MRRSAPINTARFKPGATANKESDTQIEGVPWHTVTYSAMWIRLTVRVCRGALQTGLKGEAKGM